MDLDKTRLHIRLYNGGKLDYEVKSWQVRGDLRVLEVVIDESIQHFFPLENVAAWTVTTP